jgi:hypothetical protein
LRSVAGLTKRCVVVLSKPVTIQTSTAKPVVASTSGAPASASSSRPSATGKSRASQTSSQFTDRDYAFLFVRELSARVACGDWKSFYAFYEVKALEKDFFFTMSDNSEFVLFLRFRL